MTRYVHIAHRLTGWNAIKNRAMQLGLPLTDEQIKVATNQIKALADIRPQTIDDVDTILRKYVEHHGSSSSSTNNHVFAAPSPPTGVASAAAVAVPAANGHTQ
jgi:isopropylmalate/homocitrate/citramalate synthase